MAGIPRLVAFGVLAGLVPWAQPVRAATPAGPATDIGLCAAIKSYLPPAELQRRVDLMKAAGINFVRTDFTWRSIEARRGAYNFSGHDAMMRVADRNGIFVLGLISHVPKWAAPITDHLDEWLAFVEATVKRYPQVRHWEVFNEPNLENFWGSKPDPAGYAQLLRLTYARIKAIDPKLFVTSGGLSGGGTRAGGYSSYAEPMFAAGIDGAYDALAFHPYRYPHAPEETHYAANTYAPDKPTLEQVIGKYRALMAAHGDGDKPMWITECGYTSYAGRDLSDGTKFGTGRNLGVTDEEQADFLPRSILLAFQHGVSSWMWFTTITAEKDPNDKEHWFGIVHPDHTPRPAWHALKTLRRAYPAGSTLLKERYLPGPVYRLAWRRPDGQTGWALWITERGAKQDVTFSLRGAVGESYDAVGNPVPLQVAPGRATAILSGRILYLIGPEALEISP